MKEPARQQFRWVPHTIGESTARPKDYEPDDAVQAPTPYAAWQLLKDTSRPLLPGDILESETGHLSIYKYVGFENVQWQVPEAKPAVEVPAGPAVSASAPKVEGLT